MKNRTTFLNVFIAIAIMFVVAFSFSSCTSNGANDANLCYLEVRKIFPNSQIYVSSEQKERYKFTFIVIDSTSVKLVETLSLSSPSVSKIIIFTKD